MPTIQFAQMHLLHRGAGALIEHRHTACHRLQLEAKDIREVSKGLYFWLGYILIAIIYLIIIESVVPAWDADSKPSYYPHPYDSIPYKYSPNEFPELWILITPTFICGVFIQLPTTSEKTQLFGFYSIPEKIFDNILAWWQQ